MEVVYDRRSEGKKGSVPRLRVSWLGEILRGPQDDHVTRGVLLLNPDPSFAIVLREVEWIRMTTPPKACSVRYKPGLHRVLPDQ